MHRALPLRELQASLGREPLAPVEPHGMVGQLVRFGIVGVVHTLAYTLLYLLLHSTMGAQAANLTALLLTAVANTTVDRAVTFGLAITSGSLWALHRWDPTESKDVELSILVVANLVATLVRFVTLRRVLGVRR